MTMNRVLTPPDYDRDIRHYEFDLKDTGITYGVGDCLGIYPHNDRQEVRKLIFYTWWHVAAPFDMHIDHMYLVTAFLNKPVET